MDTICIPQHHIFLKRCCFAFLVFFLITLSTVNSAEIDLVALLNQQVNIDEISVSGKRTVSNVKRKLDRAQYEQFKLFNKLVEEEDFLIICRRVGKTGTFIRARECRPSL